MFTPNPSNLIRYTKHSKSLIVIPLACGGLYHILRIKVLALGQPRSQGFSLKKWVGRKCFIESGNLYNPTMKQTNLRAGCKSALQPGTMTGHRSETFEDLLYLFSSEDKYKGFSLY